MKKIFTILLCGIFVLGLTGCGSSEEEYNLKIGDESNIVISKDINVTLSIKEGTLTKKGATFVIKNDCDNEITFGDDYFFEVKKDGVWHKIDAELNFSDEIYFFPPGSTMDFEVDFSIEKKKLPSGKYRLVKEIEEETNKGLIENYLAVEFTMD